jgi:signal peptidase I
MPRDDSNEFFSHLDQPGQRRPSSSGQQRPTDFSKVPDPFAEDGDNQDEDQGLPRSPSSIENQSARPASPAHEELGDDASAMPPISAPNLPQQGRSRTRAPRGPGLSPGVPRIHDRENPPPPEPPRSGVVLTPSGVRRVDDEPPPPPKSRAQRPPSRPDSAGVDIPDDTTDAEESDFYGESRKRNDADDMSWEEYAADGFPAMAAEEFGVKAKQTNSGRMVPVAVRSDLTDEAIKNRSVKNKGGKRPTAKAKQKPQAPKTLLGRIGDSLRLSKVVEEEIDEAPAKSSGSKRKGFAPSGSLPTRTRTRRQKTPLGIAWSIGVEFMKILLLVLLLRAYVLQVSQVQGPSMQGTLVDGDRLVVERVTPLLANNADKWWLGWVPNFMMPEFKRGDIIVVRSPEDPAIELVKRLIALPGDTLRFEDGRLLIKEAGTDDFYTVEEDYLDAEGLLLDDGTILSYRGAHSLGNYIREGMDIEVPAERIFVLGDNRGQSNDSRGWLEVDIRRGDSPRVDRLWAHTSTIEGRVVLRIWPLDRTWPPVK